MRGVNPNKAYTKRNNDVSGRPVFCRWRLCPGGTDFGRTLGHYCWTLSDVPRLFPGLDWHTDTHTDKHTDIQTHTNRHTLIHTLGRTRGYTDEYFRDLIVA